jgi:predicted nucleic acid-binding protein
MYLALQRGGWTMQQQIAKLILNEVVQVFQIQTEEYERLFALMSQYRDRPMDLADATLVIAAEKTGIKRILTLDSDFLFYRISDLHSFDVIFPNAKP